MPPQARQMTSGVCLLYSLSLNQIVLIETRRAVSKIRFESQASRRRAACRDPTRRARGRRETRRAPAVRPVFFRLPLFENICPFLRHHTARTTRAPLDPKVSIGWASPPQAMKPLGSKGAAPRPTNEVPKATFGLWTSEFELQCKRSCTCNPCIE
jgi:hypothetical protein